MAREILQDAYLDQIHPAFPNFFVTVKIDRSFSRETINFIGPDSRPMKELVSIAVVLYDERGTRMLAKIVSEDQRERVKWLIHPGAMYEVVNPSVEIGGQGVHEAYHLIFDEQTVLRASDVVFPPLPYNLKIVSQVPWRMKREEGFFDLLGFLKYVSPITKEKHMGYWEKEFFVVLESHKKRSAWPRDEVRCFLRGSFVQAVEKILREAWKDDAAVSIHVRYVISCEPTGLPTVSSYSDATTVDIDPPIPEIQKLKHQMIDPE